ncbi:HdeD family acid-resistance protein [Methylobacterium oryzae CBMB20]
MAPLWLLLVGRAAVRRHWHRILATGLVWSLLGILVVIDSLDGALHVPDRWFGLILLAEGGSSLAVGLSALGAARRLRLFKGALLTVMAVLIMMATRHSTFLLAMIFGIAFTVDGVVRITIASLLKFTGWRISVALGALSIAFGLFHLQPWPTWYAGTVGYCIGMFLILNGANLALVGLRTRRLGTAEPGLASPAGESGSLTVYVWTPTGQATTPPGSG